MEGTAACACGLPFIIGYNAVSAVLRGLGDSKTSRRFDMRIDRVSAKSIAAVGCPLALQDALVNISFSRDHSDH